MPIYEYGCTCGRVFDVFKKISELDEPEHCICGKPAVRRVSAPAVVGDYEGYQCPVTGKYIEGRRAHEENLKRTNCRLFEPGEQKDIERARAAKQEAHVEAICEDVARMVEAMPTAQKEKLAQELASGADTCYVRGEGGV